ncbi:protein-arginine deiminase type-4-like [Trichosurus vulpecula]|uniref:protein-arginine deiminase type-4-like n=1 Tax=Trichosurus vulpecula TaxID=9337 RepID=UPI00186B11A7|nr:protein-arginine deiminase type-4-like [Trichosurus vulpecula]
MASSEGTNVASAEGTNVDSSEVPRNEPGGLGVPGKTLPISLEQSMQAVCPMGTTLFVDVARTAPEGYKTFEASVSEKLFYNVEGTKFNFAFSGHPSRWYLQPSCFLILKARAPSSTMFSDWVRIDYFKSGEEHSDCVAVTNITCVGISLEVEGYQDKTQNQQGMRRHQANVYSPWRGPIMLVNCRYENKYPPDTDKEEILNEDAIHQMSKMCLTICSPLGFFNSHRLTINCSHPDKVKLFGVERPCLNPPYIMLLGPNRPSHVIAHLRNQETRKFFAEALSFPDADFSGLVSFTVSLLENSNEDVSQPPIYEEQVVFRVAPWIMIANTQPPVEIYVTKCIPKSNFISTVLDYSHVIRCKLTFCPKDETRLDTWIGNEVAFGYTYSPQQYFPVVLDCPWNKGLENFVFKNKLPSRFGYVIRKREDDDNLDATGFLEVSPPVTANGIFYPLGRILIGDGSLPRENIPEVNLRLRRFIYAQNMQDPLELFSAWLLEGNVKEFMTFVPANDEKGFRLLLASPRACYELFKLEQRHGHGNASVLEKVDEHLLQYTERVKMSIDEILADKSLKRQNDYVETCIAYNQRVLEAELGISETDIIYIPQLFRLGWIQDPTTRKEVLRAGHLFPNMLNMLVLGSYLGIPKPFGPLINGECCVEKKVQSLLEPLGLNCFFIGEFFGHQEDQGDAYYWINICRKPLPYKWWDFMI